MSTDGPAEEFTLYKGSPLGSERPSTVVNKGALEGPESLCARRQCPELSDSGTKSITFKGALGLSRTDVHLGGCSLRGYLNSG